MGADDPTAKHKTGGGGQQRNYDHTAMDVIYEEAVPPDDHTAEVRAEKARKGRRVEVMVPAPPSSDTLSMVATQEAYREDLDGEPGPELAPIQHEHVAYRDPGRGPQRGASAQRAPAMDATEAEVEAHKESTRARVKAQQPRREIEQEPPPLVKPAPGSGASRVERAYQQRPEQPAIADPADQDQEAWAAGAHGQGQYEEMPPPAEGGPFLGAAGHMPQGAAEGALLGASGGAHGAPAAGSPDAADAAAAGAVEGKPAPSTTDLAAASRKALRRERDRRAEKTALRVVIGLFIGMGVLLLAVVNSGVLFDDPPPAAPGPTGAAAAPVAPTSPPKPPTGRSLSAAPDETPDIPVLRSLTAEGLTIGAEGLPQVVAKSEGVPAALVGLEACRFAYAIWEFSPNKAFRFVTTCPALEGETLVGAYEIEGSTVLMSPLRSDPSQLTSVFQVEKPSTIVTSVMVRGRELEVRQRVTVMRPGMDAEAFRKAFASRNTTQVQGLETGGGGARQEPERRPPPPPPPPREQPPADPVLELLKQRQ